MGLIIDIKLIFNRIKKHYNVNNDAELARFFGVPPTTLSNWKARGNPNWALLFEKCEDMDFNVLIKGTPLEDQYNKLKSESRINEYHTPDAIKLVFVSTLLKDKEQEVKDLAEKNGELKYENKLLRQQLDKTGTDPIV